MRVQVDRKGIKDEQRQRKTRNGQCPEKINLTKNDSRRKRKLE